MGLLSWLFGPTDPVERIAEGRRLLAAGRYNDARHAVADLAGGYPAARDVAAEAAMGLCRLNLAAAVGYGNSGNEEKASGHLELAQEFRDQAEAFGANPAGLDGDIRVGRTEARGALQTREQEQAQRRTERKPREAGRNPFERADEVLDEQAVRVALVIESFPAALRPGLDALGPAFVKAVIDREEGRTDEAIAGLAALDDNAPLVWWERARAAHLLGDLPAAIRAARRFGTLAGGHHPIGNVHSGEWLVSRLAETGKLDEALTELGEVRAANPRLGRFLHASLLEATGKLADADRVLVSLSRDMPNEMAIYAMLGRIRIAGGQRAEALRAYEAALNQCACGTGKCGAPEPSLAIVRPLATLYLEDGIDPPRGRELADQARGMVQKPSWEDIYLAALAARGTPEGTDIAARLQSATPAHDPRAAKIRQYLQLEATGVASASSR